MNQEHYEFRTTKDSLWFDFYSVGPQSTVKKIVVYSPFPEVSDLFNLTLADSFPDGSISDTNVTDNGDMEKVLATVIQTAFRFFAKNPTKRIYIEGSTPARTRLYGAVVARELTMIQENFDVYGVSNDRLVPFVKNHRYAAFVIALKNQKNTLTLSL